MKTKELKIEKNIPSPNILAKSIFRQMEVEDSIFFKDETNYKKIANRARSNVSYYEKHRRYKFTARIVDGGVRLWRTK